MDQVHVVRHKVVVEGRSQRAVARELGLARVTVRKYVEETVPIRKETAPRPRPVWHVLGPRVDALLASGDARGAGEGHPGTGRPPGPGDDAALHALESGGARCRHPVTGDGHRIPWRNNGGGGKTGMKKLNSHEGWLANRSA